MDNFWDRYPLPHPICTVNYEGRKPLKLWDGFRSVRKGIIVGSYEELLIRGREKMGIPPTEPAMFVLDCDGTQIDDGEYFMSLPINTVLLVLRDGEFWYPSKLDALRAAVSAIPRIVCETIQSLDLEDKIPSWKIMDNKGRVTVVLHWDEPRVPHPARMHIQMERHTPPPPPPPPPPPKRFQQNYAPPSVERTRTTITPSGKKETLINDIYPPPPKYSNSPKITVINHDEVKKAAAAYQAVQRMPHSSSGLSSTIHIHTLECAINAHNPEDRAASPDNGNVQCDFHCCSLHEQGRAIVVQKSVATSPIQDLRPRNKTPPSALSDGKKSGVKQHVRFLDLEEGTTVRPGESDGSSDSDSDNTNSDDDTVITNKYLLLVDQLNRDHKDHLSIKDIGAILERLSSTIVDVEKLNRETECKGCRNWIIKAAIRGLDLNDLGLIYNGTYYVISEHPDYKEDEFAEDRKFRKESSEDHRL